MESEHERQAGAHERRSRRGFWLALLTMLGICLFVVYRSALFRLERVQILGTQRLSQAEILEVAGLTPGALKWEVPAEQVKKRLMAEPWIKAVNVSWRGNALLIEVAEREPLALLQYQERFYLVLDEEGQVLGQRLLEEGDRLPVVSGIQINRALRGERFTHLGLSDALTLLAWTGKPLRDQISEVQVRDERYLRLYLTGGTTVEVGALPDDATQRDAHIQTQLKGLLDHLERVPATKRASCQIDLRVPGKVHGLGCQ